MAKGKRAKKFRELRVQRWERAAPLTNSRLEKAQQKLHQVAAGPKAPVSESTPREGKLAAHKKSNKPPKTVELEMKPPPEEEKGQQQQQERNETGNEAEPSGEGAMDDGSGPGYAGVHKRAARKSSAGSDSKAEKRSKGYQLLSMFRATPKRKKRVKKSTQSLLL